LSSPETIAGAPETVGAMNAIAVATPKMSLKKAGMVNYMQQENVGLLGCGVSATKNIHLDGHAIYILQKSDSCHYHARDGNTVIRLFLGPIEVKETRKLISQPTVSIERDHAKITLLIRR
jgi:hypothetical protein